MIWLKVWPIIVVGLMMLMQSGLFVWKGDYWMGLQFFCYAVANVALANIGVRS